ncbi:uncharacterized protein LOC144108556 [Amblyomma americanum]
MDTPTTAAQQLLFSLYDESQGSENQVQLHTVPENEQSSSSMTSPYGPWTTGETKLLLDCYVRYTPQVGPQRRFRSKKMMYEQIAQDIQRILGVIRTGVQCETRFKTLAKRKRNEDRNNGTSGQSRCAVPYEEEFAAIRAIDDSIEPEVLRGVGKVSYKKTISNTASAAPSSVSCSDGIEESVNDISSDDPTVDSGSSFEEKENKRYRTDRKMRPSTSRMQEMALFFEEIRKINNEKEARREEREQRKVDRHQALLKADAEQMAVLKDILNSK